MIRVNTTAIGHGSNASRPGVNNICDNAIALNVPAPREWAYYRI